MNFEKDSIKNIRIHHKLFFAHSVINQPMLNNREIKKDSTLEEHFKEYKDFTIAKKYQRLAQILELRKG